MFGRIHLLSSGSGLLFVGSVVIIDIISLLVTILFGFLIFFHDSVLACLMFLEICSLLLSCPICWRVIVHSILSCFFECLWYWLSLFLFLFIFYFFLLPFSPLMPLFPHNHHTAVHVHVHVLFLFWLHLFRVLSFFLMSLAYQFCLSFQRISY